MQAIDSVDPGYFRHDQAARYLNIAPRTLTKWTQSRRVPVIDMGHRCKLYRRLDLDIALNRFRRAAIGERRV